MAEGGDFSDAEIKFVGNQDLVGPDFRRTLFSRSHVVLGSRRVGWVIVTQVWRGIRKIRLFRSDEVWKWESARKGSTTEGIETKTKVPFDALRLLRAGSPLRSLSLCFGRDDKVENRGQECPRHTNGKASQEVLLWRGR